MKKILLISLTLLLVLTGCQQNNASNQENASTADNQNSVSSDNLSSNSESQDQNESQNETEATQSATVDQASVATVDLHNQNQLVDYFYQYYTETLDSDITPLDKSTFTDNTTLTYDDFNLDGAEDVVCYSNSTTSSYKAIAFITVKDNQYTLIDTDMEEAFVYEQHIAKEGNFIIRTLTGGGTGISSTTQTLYGIVDGAILNTHTRIQTEGYESMIPTDKYPDGISHSFSSETNDMSYKVGTDNDKWLMFSHKDLTTDDLTGEIIYEKLTDYTYQPESNRYYQQVVSEEGKPGAYPPAYANDDHYEASDLVGGSQIGDFQIVSAIYNPSDNSSFIFEGSKTLEGTLYYDNEMNDDYYFESDQALFDYPLWIPIEDGRGNVQDTLTFDRLKMAWFSNDIASYLTPEMKAALNRPPYSTHVSVTISRFSLGFSAGSEGGENITITDLKGLDQDSDTAAGALSDSERAESVADQRLTQFTDESFNVNDDTVNVHYPDYRAVIIPMKNSININGLSNQLISFEGDYINRLQFTVLGEIQNVSITQINGPDDEGITQHFDSLKNTVVSIDANLPSDMSAVKVSGQFYDGEGYFIDFNFVLDDMRSNDAYDIYTFE